MKILLVVTALLAAAGAGIFLYIKAQFPSGKDTEITEGYYKKFTSDAELEMKYSQLGNYEVSYTEIPSENESIGKIRFWYPSELEQLVPTLWLSCVMMFFFGLGGGFFDCNLYAGLFDVVAPRYRSAAMGALSLWEMKIRRPAPVKQRPSHWTV